MRFPDLIAADHPDTDYGRKRVCIATADVAGPYPCGGVGAAYHGLALALARGGHDVTLLYVSDAFHRGTAPEWQSYFEALGVRFVHLPQAPAGPVWYGRRKEASFDCHRWLAAAGPFDVIHSHEWLGLPYYTLIAKRLGLAFHDTTLCIETHGPMRWSRDGEERLAAVREDLIVDFMERRCVELADVVVSPSRYMLEWMHADGWRLPERSFVAQNVLATPEAPADPADGSGRAVHELVFFGRLDRRKGVGLFCDVVDRLEADARGDFAVTFLGSTVHFDGKPSDDYIRARSARWRCTTRLVTDHGREEAFAYLAHPGRLAVMPARLDNLPCTVHECIQIGLPFLATDVGGTAELVAPADRAAVLCPPDAGRIAARLVEILAGGQRRATPAVDRAETERTWVAWHRTLPAPSPRRPDAPRAPGAAPLISVCIAHYERPALLEQMLASLEHQTHRDFEVIVCDDGSPTAATAAYLATLGERLTARGWTLLRAPNRGPGSARHAAAERARGAYLLFLDDDDYAEPHALATLARCAQHSGVDALVPVYRSFTGSDAPDGETPVRRWFLPLGPALAPSLIFPEVGGAMVLVKREVYFACGGFAADRDVDEDWELLVTLIQRGYDLDVVPIPLFWYRDQEISRSRADNRFARTRSRIRLYERMLPPALRDLAALALTKLAGAADSESLRRLERVRQVLDKREQRPADPIK